MEATSKERGARSLKFHPFLVEYAPDYLERFATRMPPRLSGILNRILLCRSGLLGGHAFRCGQCGQSHYQYHSCNDRHCPQCGQADAQAWLGRQKRRLLLPTPYFLVTFTVPEALRAWIRSHLKIGLDTLYAASSQALQDLAANPKRLGAQLGMLGIVHTWSRTLIFHPHIHYLMPGGGLSADGRSWIAAKPHYLLSVRALGARCRTLFKEALQKEPELFRQIPAKVWKQKWIVHSQPAGFGDKALGYLSAYIFKTATANRLLSVLPTGKVRWPYRDSKTRRPAAIELEPNQLISRFLQHVLPPHFCRVRLFGWLHPAARVRANRVRALLGEKPVLTPEELRAWQPHLEEEPALDAENARPSSTPVCPRCGQPMEPAASWQTGQMPTAFWPKARPP